MRVEELSVDIVGLAGACSYALDCIEAEFVNVKTNMEREWLILVCVWLNIVRFKVMRYKI